MGADKKEPLFRTQSQPSVHAGLRDGLVVVAIGTEKLPEYWWAIQLSTGAFEEEYGQSPIYFLIQSKPQSLSPSEADNKATKFVESQRLLKNISIKINLYETKGMGQTATQMKRIKFEKINNHNTY